MYTEIYVLRDETRYLRYVGKTKQRLTSRLARHLKDAQNGRKTHKCNWIRSMLTNGFLPSITLIEEVEGNGCKEERKWIKYLKNKGVDLVNGTDGGEGIPGFLHSEQTKQKISEAHKGISVRGSGWRHSKETRKKISLAHHGMRHSKKTKIKMCIAKQRMTVKTKKKIGAAGKGRICSLETRQKMSFAHKGKGKGISMRGHGWHHSEETKRKISHTETKTKKEKKSCVHHS